MLTLSPADLARVKQLTDRAYKYLHPDVRLYLNEQLLECTNWSEYADWATRLDATAKYYEEGPMHVGISRKRRKLDGERASR